ncbi:CoA transferase [Mycolicibacterium sp. XJ870]
MHITPGALAGLGVIDLATVIMGPFATATLADGWICIMPYSAQNWRDFFAAAGRPELVDNPRYATVDYRHRHMGELLTAVREAPPQRTTAEWLKLCESHSIPASDLLDLADGLNNDYVAGQELLAKRTHPTEGEYYATRTPFTMSRPPVSLHRHAPLLGQDTAEVLAGLGYPDDDIAVLAESGVTRATSMATR